MKGAFIHLTWMKAPFIDVEYGAGRGLAGGYRCLGQAYENGTIAVPSFATR